MNTTMDRRTWTDAQLRDAVERSQSWRAVARALGLKGTSAGVIRTVKRHAKRLGLDASHFTGQRRWSDQQLREAVLRSTCWAEVILGLGVVDNAEYRVRVKGHATRLGLDYTHLKMPHLPSLTGEVFSEPVQPTMLRTAAPAMAMAWFALRGCAVALPVEPQEYDLLVTTKKGIQRVQVKSSTLRDAAGRWSVGVGRRPYTLDKSAGKMPYDPESLDLFFIVVGDGSIYLIPSAVLAGRVRIYVESYAPYRVGDASSLLQSGH
jgi:hypothetical protein